VGDAKRGGGAGGHHGANRRDGLDLVVLRVGAFVRFGLMRRTHLIAFLESLEHYREVRFAKLNGEIERDKTIFAIGFTDVLVVDHHAIDIGVLRHVLVVNHVVGQVEIGIHHIRPGGFLIATHDVIKQRIIGDAVVDNDLEKIQEIGFGRECDRDMIARKAGSIGDFDVGFPKFEHERSYSRVDDGFVCFVVNRDRPRCVWLLVPVVDVNTLCHGNILQDKKVLEPTIPFLITHHYLINEPTAQEEKAKS
jgi:hypothetical protein